MSAGQGYPEWFANGDRNPAEPEPEHQPAPTATATTALTAVYAAIERGAEAPVPYQCDYSGLAALAGTLGALAEREQAATPAAVNRTPPGTFLKTPPGTFHKR